MARDQQPPYYDFLRYTSSDSRDETTIEISQETTDAAFARYEKQIAQKSSKTIQEYLQSQDPLYAQTIDKVLMSMKNEKSLGDEEHLESNTVWFLRGAGLALEATKAQGLITQNHIDDFDMNVNLGQMLAKPSTLRAFFNDIYSDSLKKPGVQAPFFSKLKSLQIPKMGPMAAGIACGLLLRETNPRAIFDVQARGGRT